jgi:hypothetical protein
MPQYHYVGFKKIILTTDDQLIADGIQPIDDEFLEWFVKNPSCESVEVKKVILGKVEGTSMVIDKYKIIIPQEEPNPFELPKALPDDVFYESLEPKQETTDEELLEALKSFRTAPLVFVPNERMYSEEEVEIIIQKLMNDVHCGDLCYGDNVIDFKKSPRKWFEQFKKK